MLGVSKTASQTEIRESFRNLALKYHPDRNKNSEDAKQKFMQIVEAYEFLSEEQMRKDYDETHWGYYDHISTQNRSVFDNSYGAYTYAEIKKRYMQSSCLSRVCNVRINENVTIWKSTMVLFESVVNDICRIIIATYHLV
jgi:DnaJ-class molecular chaperone